MNILIYEPAAENAGGFLVDVCGEQAQIDITNTLSDTVHCMQNTFYTMLLAENLTADDGFALLDVLNMQDSIRFPPHVIGITPEWEESIRLTNCSLDISREKTAMVFFSFKPIFSAIFKANAVLPIPGRAAIRIRSLLPRPNRKLSKLAKRVGSP